jgi:hypothetical protein
MAAVRLSCLARNGRSPGEESLTAAVAVQAIEAQPAFGQIKPMRGKVLACAEQHLGDVPANDRLKQEAPHSQRRNRKPGVQKGGPLSPNRQKPAYRQQPRVQSADEITRLNPGVREDRDVAISNDALISASCQPRDNRRA